VGLILPQGEAHNLKAYFFVVKRIVIFIYNKNHDASIIYAEFPESHDDWRLLRIYVYYRVSFGFFISHYLV
jgi:hypothetical protein